MGIIFYEATINDRKFINDIVIEDSKHGFYNRSIEAASGITSWDLDLKYILENKKRINGFNAQAYIYAHNEIPIGFFIMSVFDLKLAQELWMASIVSKYRRKGFGNKMLNGILEQVNSKKSKLLARCSKESKIAFDMLIKKGFKKIGETNDGYRLLGYKVKEN